MEGRENGGGKEGEVTDAAAMRASLDTHGYGTLLRTDERGKKHENKSGWKRGDLKSFVNKLSLK